MIVSSSVAAKGTGSDDPLVLSQISQRYPARYQTHPTRPLRSMAVVPFRNNSKFAVISLNFHDNFPEESRLKNDDLICYY
jgi:hypothetical protein